MSLLQMSLSGGMMILAVVLVRAFALHRLPKRFFVLLWMLVLARLLIPFSLPSACSIYSLMDQAAPVSSAVTEASPLLRTPILHGSGAVSAPTVSEGGASIHVDPWSAIWLAGMLGCGLFFAVAYVKCRRKFREALPVHGGFVEGWLMLHPFHRPISVRQSDRIAAPLTYGILRPVILLPKSAELNDTETLRYVLTHEWVHIRRFDGLLKLALTAALCVYWFNPLVWVMVLLANRDIELACDEAVLKLLGGETKAGYALALLRMEEKRSGLLAIGSHFSKNSLEERIKAMLKRKKTSLAALLAAVVLIGGTGAVFATSAKAENQDASLRPGAEAETTYSTEAKDSLMSYTDADGVTYYSWDEGKTWTPMTEEEFAAAYPDSEVEWWTAEEYADWLENEKKELQSIIGSKGWTSGTGWFTWTQEMVDETIAEYEDVLAMIENGYLVSKSVDGDEDTLIMSGAPMLAAETEDDDVSIMAHVDNGGLTYYGIDDELVMALGEKNKNLDYKALFTEYKGHGISYDKDGNLYWNGQLVRIFVDGVEYEGGFFSQYEHYDPDGTVDLHTVRERKDNGDGSYDPMGKLVRIEEFEPDQMFMDALDCQREMNRIQAEADARTESELAPYLEFGLTYSFERFQKSNWLRMTWNGQPVRSLFDPERQLWACNSLGTKGLNLEAVYENGKLTGLRESQEDSSIETGTVIDEEAAVAESDRNDGSGETIAQRMERYASYGVSYQEIGGKKIIRYHGQAVDSFTDIAPDGSVFSVGSTDGGEISLTTVYDKDGGLSGVKPFISYRF